MKTYVNKNLAAAFLFASLLANSAVCGEEAVPRRLCAFVDIQGEHAATGDPGQGESKDSDKIAEGTNQVGGVTFDVASEVVVLSKGDSLEIGLSRLRYAGEEGIESQYDHDRGPLVLRRIEAIYLLHSAPDNPEGKTLGKWAFEYEDGSKWDEALRMGENIGNKDGEAEWADKAGQGFYVTKIGNPHFDKKVKFIAIEIEGRARYVLAAVTCKLGREPPHSF